MAHDKTKAAARQRMAETGEPYAAARRAVVSEHGAGEGHAPPEGAGYPLRMSGEIRDWLAGLRDGDPPTAMVVVQALAALLNEGPGLGDPLVVSTADSWPWALAEGLNRSYQEMLEQLSLLRRREADAASLVIDLSRQAAELESTQAWLADLHRRAVDEGSPQEAAQAAATLAAAQREAAEMRRLLPEATQARERLRTAVQRRQDRVEAFRTRKEVLRASYTAARGSILAQEAIAAFDRAGADAGQRQHESDAAASTGSARLLRDVTAEMERELGQQPWPEGLMELRTGGTGTRVLFAIEPPGTVLLIAVIEGGEAAQDQRPEAILLSADLLRRVRAGQEPEAAAHGYDIRLFLEEYYPASAEDADGNSSAR
jgi:phage shock protein A